VQPAVVILEHQFHADLPQQEIRVRVAAVLLHQVKMDLVVLEVQE
jgi:hypothetical protein